MIAKVHYRVPQEITTRPSRKSDESSSRSHILCFKVHFILIQPYTPMSPK
jgi:hypothetical protein